MKKPAFIKIAERELEFISKDKFAVTLLVILPVIVYLFLSFVYIKGALRDIPVAVYDADHSEVSRTVTSMIESSPAMNITYYLSSGDELEDFFLKHDELALFYIPSGFAKDIYRNKSTRLVVFTNSANIVYGNMMYREAATIAGTVSAGITISRLEHAGIDHNTSMGLIMPVKVYSKILFNPWFNYLYYLVPGIMTVLLQMFIFFVSARAFNKEIRFGTLHEMVETGNGSALQILTGKLLAYLSYGLSIIMLIAIIFMLFDIPFKQKIVELIVLFTIFTIVNISLGFMLSATIDDELVALDLAFFYNSPAFVFSGFTFPLFGMPFFNSLYGQFIPYTHFLHAYFKLYQMGAPFHYIIPDLKILVVFMATGLITTYVALRLRIKEETETNQIPVSETV
ncbi:MAG: ABC transporter permease [Chlorobi bacterium]|nr:ABC transporter permease [Chlorobiota bacterium]